VAQFITDHRDFIIFLSLFAFMLCALECVVLNREEDRERRWLSYFSFYLFEGLATFLLLIATVVTPSPVIALLPPFMQALAFGSLFAFGTNVRARPLHRWGMVAMAFLLIAGCSASGLLLGPAVFSVLLIVFLGVPGVVFLVRFILSDPIVQKPGRPWLMIHVVALIAYGLVALAQQADVLLLKGEHKIFFFATLVVLAGALCITLSLHEWGAFRRMNRNRGGRLMRAIVYSAFVLLLIILGAAWFVVNGVGSLALAERRLEYLNDIEMLRTVLTAQTTRVGQVSTLLSSSPPIITFLQNPGEVSKEIAEERLNQYAGQMPGTTCYLLDRAHMAVASSVGDEPISFVGHHLADMPDFVDLLSSSQHGFFARGRLSGRRGYFAYSAIRSTEGGVLGFAVIKQDFESLFEQSSPIQNVFFVNREGIVFLSSDAKYAYRPLWPLSDLRQRLVEITGQSDPASAEPELSAEVADGSIILWHGERAIVTRLPVGIAGWSIVHFGFLKDVALYRLAGLLVFLLIAFLIAVFSATGRISMLDRARIERSETRYKMLVEGSPSWISMIDETGKFQFTNNAGWRSLGLKAASRPIESILGNDGVATIKAQIGAALQGGAVAFESILPSDSGEKLRWRIMLLPVRTPDAETVVILIGNDITDLKRAEARMVRAERMAALGTLTGGIAHQFNNINAIALGYVQVLEMEPDLPERTLSYLHSLRAALERSVDITTQLLPLSIVDSAGEVPQQLSQAVRAAATGVCGGSSGAEVEMEITVEEGLSVTINREQLSFVLNTLLVNALHAVLGEPSPRIRVSTGKLGTEKFIRVEDNGIGIAREKLSSLFTPFFSEKGEHAPPASPQARVKGVGLGLVVSQSIVTARAGRIEVESTAGVGSTFTVWLPAGVETEGLRRA